MTPEELLGPRLPQDGRLAILELPQDVRLAIFIFVDLKAIQSLGQIKNRILHADLCNPLLHAGYYYNHYGERCLVHVALRNLGATAIHALVEDFKVGKKKIDVNATMPQREWVDIIYSKQYSETRTVRHLLYMRNKAWVSDALFFSCVHGDISSINILLGAPGIDLSNIGDAVTFAAFRGHAAV